VDLHLAGGPGLESSLNAPSVRAVLRAEIDRCAAGLPPHEVVREFLLLPEAPTVGNGGLTPTNKLRRGELERKYSARISVLYQRSKG
jgi:long-subunit acyl-CoA synthetase (AMP-forming)